MQSEIKTCLMNRLKNGNEFKPVQKVSSDLKPAHRAGFFYGFSLFESLYNHSKNRKYPPEKYNNNNRPAIENQIYLK
jgi:hypothetical protein